MVSIQIAHEACQHSQNLLRKLSTVKSTVRTIILPLVIDQWFERPCCTVYTAAFRKLNSVIHRYRRSNFIWSLNVVHSTEFVRFSTSNDLSLENVFFYFLLFSNCTFNWSCDTSSFYYSNIRNYYYMISAICNFSIFFFKKMGWNNRKIWKWIIEQFRENCEFQTKFVLNFNVLTQRECHEVTGYYLRFFQLINHNLFYAWIHNFCELYKQMWPQNFPQRNLYIMHCSLESIVFSGGRFENL